MSTKLTNVNSSGSIGELDAASLNLHELFIKDTSLNENDKKIITEFVHLLDKSKQLFNGLRDLPQFGHKNSQWQAYFGRTFDVYTKLWKFQQQNRQVLDSKYNLKRWQIGDIASKIGQLYYHYYLRTSESNYLNEAFSFYNAIQSRSYYSKANKEEKPDLMVKKLRYMARFIVVCLLLQKTKQVKELIKDLGRQIDDYVKIYDPEDALEWQLVRNEINDFIEADNLLYVDNSLLIISNRLNSKNNSITIDRLSSKSVNLSLGEIIIIGNCDNQIKFSELSLDMYRMLQAVEREPSLTESNKEKLNQNNELSYYNPVHRDNPHKYLLYKPTISQSLTFISAAFKDLQPHSVLMIYISADASESHAKIKIDGAYDHGGVHTNNKKDNLINQNGNNENFIKKSSNLKEIHCIYPGDLYAYTRKPLFLIIDSPNSAAFQNFPYLFGQPFVSFLSPIKLPQMFQESSFKGNLFTLFLTNSLTAFCYVCNLNNIPQVSIYEKAVKLVDQIHDEIFNVLNKSRQLDYVYLQYLQDEFIRSFIIRFVFCNCVLRLHHSFTKNEEFLPTSQPKIPLDVVNNEQLSIMILNLALLLETRQLFTDSNDIDE